MATDSTELTFVRCPSCRSLVPAVSVRCRICGATLDSSQSSQRSEEAAKRSGRVRMRTLNQQDSAVVSAIEQIREEGSEPPADEEAQSAADPVPAAADPEPAQAEEPAPEPLPENQTAYKTSDNADSGEFGSVEPGSSDDPLSAYLEEIEDQPAKEQAAQTDKEDAGEDSPADESKATPEPMPWDTDREPVPQLKASAADSEDDDTENETSFPDIAEEPARKPAEVAFDNSDDTDAFDPLAAEEEEAPVLEEPQEAPASKAPERQERERPRVLMESGNRRHKHGGGLSFGRPRHERQDDRKHSRDEQRQPGKRDDNRPNRDRFEGKKNREFSQEKSGRDEQRHGKQAPVSSSPYQGRRDIGGRKPLKVSSADDNFGSRFGHDRPGRKFEETATPQEQAAIQPAEQPVTQPAVTVISRPERPVAEVAAGPDRKVEQPPVVEKSREVVADEKPKTETAVVAGRLAGWLVSFKDPAGRATELREGRFFVTRSSLKGADLVIDDKSVSVPHAMVAVRNGEVRVQDLMSDEGVWIKKSGASSWERIEETARIRPDDFVKFGNIEFRVVILG